MFRTENALIHIGCPIPFDTDCFLTQMDSLITQAEANSAEIRDAVRAIVSTYHPSQPEVTIVKDAKYMALIHEAEEGTDADV